MKMIGPRSVAKVMIDKAPVDWLTLVSLSTIESEFVTKTEAIKNLVSFDRMHHECSHFNILQNNGHKAVMLVDNQTTIDFVKSPVESCKSKHIEVKLFFIR